MHNKYIITYECHDNALRMWKVVQLEKYFDFSLYSHHFSLLSLFSLLSALEREVTSPSDFKVVGALPMMNSFIWPCFQSTVSHWKSFISRRKSYPCKTRCHVTCTKVTHNKYHILLFIGILCKLYKNIYTYRK